jgi:ABC-2 type transport system permease protein
MNRYLAMARTSFMTGLAWRAHFVLTFVTNAVYLIVIYFLWRSIYGGAGSLNGMTFEQVFVYLALASSIFVLFDTFTEWEISTQILQGTIATYLSKPVDYQLLVLFRSAGMMFSNVMLITVPTVLIVFGLLRMPGVVGINLLFLPVSLALAYVLSFSFDYVVGLTSFYTESVWGLSMVKKIVIMVLSGMLIPLQFFPEGIRHVLEYLPFQAIYHTPLSLITDPTLGAADYARMVGVQALWVVLLVGASRLFYSQAIKAVTINGG